MTVLGAIQVLEAAYEMFGDVPVTFRPPDKPGEKYKLVINNADSTKKKENWLDQFNGRN